VSNGHTRENATPNADRRRDIDAPDSDSDQDPVADFQHTVGNRATGQILLAKYSPDKGRTRRAGGTGGSSSTTTLPTKPAKPPWYQEILDLIADEQKNVITLGTGTTVGGDALPWMNEVKDVALALDAKDVKATKTAIKVLLKDQPMALYPYVISERLDHEMVSRAFALGLAPEAMDLLRYFRRRNEYREPPAWHPHSYAEDRAMWERVAAEATAGGAPKDATAASNVLNKVQPTFTAMALELSQLDYGRVQSDYSLRHDPSIGLLAGPYDQSISEYHHTLKELVDRLYVQLETAEQLLINEAEAQLEKGKGTKALETAKRAHASLDVAITSVKDEIVDTTRSEFGKKGKHFDYFTGKADKARTIGITFFDSEQTEGEEMKRTYGAIADARDKQLKFLERLYGLQTKGGKPTDEAVSNEAAIKAMGGRLRLHNTDDWRQFLSAKLKQMRAAGISDGDALDQMLDLVRAYFKAFAVHTPYNIEEGGDNYLTRSFPRALTGKLLHDCGVYALRIAYMLSLVRKELHLDIKFIILPHHIGLVLTGDAKHSGLPTYIIQNDTFSKFTAARLTTLRDQWLNTDAQGVPLAKPQARDDVQFMGELAAAVFEDTDAPFKLMDVPKLTAPNTTALQKKYFDLYQDAAKQRILVDEPGKTGIKNFEDRYSRLAEAENALSGRVVPFWNDLAPAIWARHKARLLEALRGIRAQQLGKSAYQAARDDYVNDLESQGGPLLKWKEELVTEEADIAATLAAHPKLLAKGARTFPTARWGFSSQSRRALDALEMHLADLAFEDDLDDPAKEDQIEPPFVKPGGKIILDE